MPIATLTSKGQITIPKEVRERLGLRAGDRLSFEVREDGKAELQPVDIDLLSLRGSVKSRIRGVSLRQMKRDIEKAAVRR